MEFEDQVGVESPGEEFETGTEQGVAQGQEDQQASAESQTETEEAPDLSQPMFAFTGADGQEKELTGEDILAALEAQGKVSELEARLAGLEAKDQATADKPVAETKPAETAGGEEATVAWDKVGEIFSIMLEGGDEERQIGGIEEIGPALRWMVETTAKTLIQQEFASREAKTEAKSAYESFTQDFQDFEASLKDGRLNAFRAERSLYAKATDTEAYLAMKYFDLQKDLEAAKTGNTKKVENAAKQAAREAEQKTIKNLRTKGTLRPLTGRSKVASTQEKYDLRDFDQRSAAMAEGLNKLRAGGGT